MTLMCSPHVKQENTDQTYHNIYFKLTEILDPKKKDIEDILFYSELDIFTTFCNHQTGNYVSSRRTLCVFFFYQAHQLAST